MVRFQIIKKNCNYYELLMTIHLKSYNIWNSVDTCLLDEVNKKNY